MNPREPESPVDFLVRPERPGDADGICRVHEQAFPGPDEARLVDLLRASGNLVVSLVAESVSEIVGHIAFSPVTADGSAPWPGVGLAPVAVLPAHQRRGIGKRLIAEGVESCRARGLGFVVVLGDPDYYNRLGFTQAGAHGLDNEYGADEAFRILELQAGGLPGPGTVRYGPEFGAFAT